MFTALIIDDEELSRMAIRQMVSWSALKVDCVLEASNGCEAQRILKSNPVQLMICDIEMPQMDGLTLVEWLRAERMDTEVIMLTCHASFDMAQRALRLGSIEYILKPVSPAVLATAAEQALNAWQKKANDRLVNQQWNKSISIRRNQYLSDIIMKNISSEPDALKSYANRYGLEFRGEEKIYMVLVCVERIDVPAKDTQITLYGLRNAAEELWVRSLMGWGCLINCADKWFVLAGTGATEEMFEKAYCQQLEEFAFARLNAVISTYTAKPCRIHELSRQLEMLQKNHANKQFLRLSALGANDQANEQIWRNTQARWRGYVENRALYRIQEEIHSAIKGLSGSAAQRTQYLLKIKACLLSAIRAGMQENAIQLTRLLEDQEFREEHSLFTEAQFVIWTEWLLQRLDEWQKGSENPSEVIEKIQKYITMNIHRDITREDIAAIAFLNPDYAARLFKKETGMTLNAYIVKKRIALAKQLLLNTDMAVGDISGGLGYSSFSHFSKIFKNSEGVTPSEYRRVNREVD